MYARGKGVPKDTARAMALMRQAADMGDVGAQYNLGRSYALGEWVTQSYVEAANWLTKAARQGLPAAQSYLGFLHGNGLLGAPDHQQAFVWYSLAARRLPEGADRDKAERERNLARAQLSAEQIAEAEKQVAAFGRTP